MALLTVLLNLMYWQKGTVIHCDSFKGQGLITGYPWVGILSFKLKIVKKNGMRFQWSVCKCY